jgi:hypothetical protein
MRKLSYESMNDIKEIMPGTDCKGPFLLYFKNSMIREYLICNEINMKNYILHNGEYAVIDG